MATASLGLGLGVTLLSLRLLPLLLWLPRLGWLARGLLFAVCELFVLAQGLDTLPRLAATDPLQLAFPLLHELALGLLLGLLFATLWGALAAAARLAGLGEALGEDTTETASLLGSDRGVGLTGLWSLCGTALFFALDGAGQLLAIVAHSYALVPLPGRDAEPSPFYAASAQVVAIGGRLFVLTLLLALPVLVPRVFGELFLALATRSLLGAQAGAPRETALSLTLRPLLFLTATLLGGAAALTLWQQQGRPLFALLRLPLGGP